MVLPTSKENFITTSIDCPTFYKEMSFQCFAISFFLGLTAFVNSYVHEWAPDAKTRIGDIAANITGNENYAGYISYLNFLFLYNIFRNAPDSFYNI